MLLSLSSCTAINQDERIAQLEEEIASLKQEIADSRDTNPEIAPTPTPTPTPTIQRQAQTPVFYQQNGLTLEYHWPLDKLPLRGRDPNYCLQRKRRGH